VCLGFVGLDSVLAAPLTWWWSVTHSGGQFGAWLPCLVGYVGLVPTRGTLL